MSINESNILVSWVILQPRFKEVMEVALLQKQHQFQWIKSTGAKDLGQAFCTKHENFSKIHYTCAEIDTFLAQERVNNLLLRLIMDNGGGVAGWSQLILLNNRAKQLGLFIKTTSWWKTNKKSLTKLALANQTISTVMSS